MKKKLWLTLAVMMVLMSAGCGTKVKLKDGKEVVATVGEQEFTAEELFDSLKEKYGSAVLADMVDDYIIGKEIEDDKTYQDSAKAQLNSMKSYYEQYNYEWKDVLSYYGFKTDKEFLASYTKDLEKQEIVKNYLKEQITDDEIQKYYDEEIYGDYTAKHILIKVSTTSTMSDDEKKKAKEDALKKAEEAIEKLNNGEKWADIVKEYSDDSDHIDDEGLLPAFTNGDYVDSFFKATIALEDGEYTKEPVESTYGYHIINRISATEKPSLEDSKEKVLNKIAENKLNNDEQLATQTWIKVREKYEFKIDDSIIKKAYEESI